jgi:hypothetical protein
MILTMTTVTKQDIDLARGQAKGSRFLHVPVSAEFLRRVNICSAQRGQSIKEFVIESILLRIKEGGKNGPKATR